MRMAKTYRVRFDTIDLEVILFTNANVMVSLGCPYNTLFERRNRSRLHRFISAFSSTLSAPSPPNRRTRLPSA